ncbi:MAG TPA: hypothetical protein VH352_24710 [Pseudonocardiaceae bacterium]|jgi:hypothetical protein|nr:hypothetical protein [Pseudonocardiaceae bacterium]
MRTVTYRLHDWAVRVAAPVDRAFEHFDPFYDRAARPSPPAFDLTVLSPPPQGLSVRDHRASEWGVVIDHVDENRCHVYAATADEAEVCATARRLIRHVWFDRLARSQALLVLHASAVDDGKRVIAFAGNKFSGKTTMLLDSIATHGHTMITNDNLMVHGDQRGPVLTATPTFVRIRQDTAERYHDFLSARARDPLNQRNYAGYRRDRGYFGPENALLLSFGVFGDARLPLVPLHERELLLVDTAFSDDKRVHITESPRTVRAIRDFSSAMLKTAEVVKSITAGRLYPTAPLPELGVPELLLAQLHQRARLVVYRHQGEVGPLLDFLADRAPESVAVGDGEQ